MHQVHRSCEIADDNEKNIWGVKMEALQENSMKLVISNRWYAELNFHHVFTLEITDFSFEPLVIAAQYWKCKIWNNLLCVNMRFLSSNRFGCVCMLTGSSCITTVLKEQVSPKCVGGTRSTLIVGSTVEDTVLLLFGLCHRRWTTAPSLLILKFNSGDLLGLSSVKPIR